eukprot:CAMPEP_0173246304 /NCGR_PEP_ID=MMETSP1142-20121109/17242_1 /TAXON_ID=483371 /ORGANISM="non described non described, Strain CCMP2298" /LENGTH=119 /DNA_ID=CAMNT_0014178511 /DNA_START=687 /DNA_END=1046 /DNA_ORIENTATION=+
MGGGLVPGPSPPLHLVFAILEHALLLVRAHQCAVVALVEAPVLLHCEPLHAHFAQSQVDRVRGPHQQTCVHCIELQPVLVEHLPGSCGLPAPLLCERRVRHADEDALLVPRALPVAQES